MQVLHLNDRAENPHQPSRQRERRMTRSKSVRQAQQFLPGAERSVRWEVVGNAGGG